MNVWIGGITVLTDDIDLDYDRFEYYKSLVWEHPDVKSMSSRVLINGIHDVTFELNGEVSEYTHYLRTCYEKARTAPLCHHCGLPFDSDKDERILTADGQDWHRGCLEYTGEL